MPIISSSSSSCVMRTVTGAARAPPRARTALVPNSDRGAQTPRAELVPRGGCVCCCGVLACHGIAGGSCTRRVCVCVPLGEKPKSRVTSLALGVCVSLPLSHASTHPHPRAGRMQKAIRTEALCKDSRAGGRRGTSTNGPRGRAGRQGRVVVEGGVGPRAKARRRIAAAARRDAF